MLLSIFGIVMCGIGLWLDIYLIALVGMLVGAVGMYALCIQRRYQFELGL